MAADKLFLDKSLRSGHPVFPSYTLSFYGHDTKQHHDTLTADDTPPRASWRPMATTRITDSRDSFSNCSYNPKKARPKNALKKGLKPTKHSDLPPRKKNVVGRRVAKPSTGVRTRSTTVGSNASHLLSPPASSPPPQSRGRRSPARSPPYRHPLQAKQMLRPERPIDLTACKSPTQSPPSNPLLNTYELNNTTLHIYINNTDFFIPVKLRSCITIQTFFNVVARVCGREHEVDEISFVGVEFERRREEGDRSGVMGVMRDVQDSWDVFLQEVDRGIWWDKEGEKGAQKGECVVSVRVAWKVGMDQKS
ncbi:MAG: hypothetical protein Q9190_001073 [Brigantiaea leucoxantha]